MKSLLTALAVLFLSSVCYAQRSVTVNPTNSFHLYPSNYFSRNFNTTDFTFSGTTNNRVKLTTFVQAGSAVLSSDGALTNSFTTAYASAPVVVISATQTNNPIYVGAITTTNVIL
jgi:hypothetical protein